MKGPGTQCWLTAKRMSCSSSTRTDGMTTSTVWRGSMTRIALSLRAQASRRQSRSQTQGMLTKKEGKDVAPHGSPEKRGEMPMWWSSMPPPAGHLHSTKTRSYSGSTICASPPLTPPTVFVITGSFVNPARAKGLVVAACHNGETRPSRARALLQDDTHKVIE